MVTWNDRWQNLRQRTHATVAMRRIVRENTGPGPGTGVAFSRRMHASELIALASDVRFVPFVYDYCDMWCDRCPVTSRCLAFALEERQAVTPARRCRVIGDIEDRLALARAVVAAGATASPVAILDVRLANPMTAPKAGHPLEWLARHYATEASRLLTCVSLSHPEVAASRWSSPLGVLSWYHILIAAKVYRACVSSRHGRDVPALRDDASGSAKVALIGIERSLEALRDLAPTLDGVRVQALTELLEALRTGVELKFPDARTFIRPGLDAPGGGQPC